MPKVIDADQFAEGSGVLYVVATPIGNLEDISGRAAEVLRAVDLIAAEDTRHTRVLLGHLGVSTKMVALHQHNERQQSDGLVERLLSGLSLALVSDAGTPLISDPGFPLVRECHRRRVRVSPVPGACALVAALSVSGLATDRFLFVGFLARTAGARLTQLKELRATRATMVFYESSHRVVYMVRDLVEVLGGDRQAALAREITKIHEAIVSEPLGKLLDRLIKDPDQQKGEFVLLVEGVKLVSSDVSEETRRVMDILCAELPLKQAARIAARITGEKKNRLYQLALSTRRS